MHANKGFKVFGQKAIAAMVKEYQQMGDMTVFGRRDPNTITDEDKERSLELVNLIKEKRCGKIKGRACANGAPQRAYVPREEAASPTVSTESFMMTLVIDAKEERATQCFDVPGAYLQTDIPNDKSILLKITGKFVDIMVEANPEFKDDVRIENGIKVLFVQAKKAIYGLIESALLWYESYSTTLKDMGFSNKPKRQVCSQQNNNWQPMQNCMGCG